ncbi:MAG: ATP-binding protein [Acholeplasmatales bacterium]|nr:ATP-binding protein [Acholeplasmatales bacterium]
MVNIDNLRNQFIECKIKIENALYIRSYDSAKEYIAEGLEILDELLKHDRKPRNIATYKKTIKTLQEKLIMCHENLGESLPFFETNYVENKTTNLKTAPKTTKTVKVDKNKKDQKSEDGIQYKFNDIDVKAFLTDVSNDVVTFEDVIGMDSEKEMIKNEFFLTEQDIAFNKKIGKKNKNFILLYGLPGTGKTYFAKAVSNELNNYFKGNVRFYSVVCTSLKGSGYGDTENRILAIFEFAKQFERCVLFMDEFESIALSRQNDLHEVTASAVSTLLQMIDGFNSNNGLLLIAATNVPYNLDSAVVSRASLKIEVPLPSFDIIYPTLKKKLGEFVASDVNLEQLARKLNGYSNRDISNFIVMVLDIYSMEYKKHRGVNPEDFKICNEYINRALAKSSSTIKESEVKRLEAYNKGL